MKHALVGYDPRNSVHRSFTLVKSLESCGADPKGPFNFQLFLTLRACQVDFTASMSEQDTLRKIDTSLVFFTLGLIESIFPIQFQQFLVNLY